MTDVSGMAPAMTDVDARTPHCCHPVNLGHGRPCLAERHEEIRNHLEHVRQIAADNHATVDRLMNICSEILQICEELPPKADSSRHWTRVRDLAQQGLT